MSWTQWPWLYIKPTSYKLLPEGVFNHAMFYLFYSPDVKHPLPSNSKSDFRSLLLQLSNSLTGKELQALKFLCGDVLPRDKLETINHGFELFEALEHLNKLSVRDRDFLASKLIAVNRIDLRNHLLEIEG